MEYRALLKWYRDPSLRGLAWTDLTIAQREASRVQQQRLPSLRASPGPGWLSEDSEPMGSRPPGYPRAGDRSLRRWSPGTPKAATKEERTRSLLAPSRELS